MAKREVSYDDRTCNLRPGCKRHAWRGGEVIGYGTDKHGDRFRRVRVECGCGAFRVREEFSGVMSEFLPQRGGKS